MQSFLADHQHASNEEGRNRENTDPAAGEFDCLPRRSGGNGGVGPHKDNAGNDKPDHRPGELGNPTLDSQSILMPCLSAFRRSRGEPPHPSYVWNLPESHTNFGPPEAAARQVMVLSLDRAHD